LFVDILADPMQCVAAGWEGMIVDVDHHLKARQMLRQRSTVDATLGGMACSRLAGQRNLPSSSRLVSRHTPVPPQ
jgi:hypothetical protein